MTLIPQQPKQVICEFIIQLLEEVNLLTGDQELNDAHKPWHNNRRAKARPTLNQCPH